MGETIQDPKSKIHNRLLLPPDACLAWEQYDAARAEGWQGLLSDEERARLDGYGVTKRQREFLLGRVVARQLLAGVLGCAPQAVPLSVTPDGAVEVRGENARALRLSISHTGDDAVAVAARRPVGVDLEGVAPRPERLHRFLLAEAERPLLRRLPLPEDDAFALCWALKEAALKALRCGLRRSPKTLRLSSVDPEAGTARLDTPADGAFEARFERNGPLWLAVVYAPGAEQ